MAAIASPLLQRRKEPDEEQLLKLFWNRAELKKELGKLRLEKEKLLDQLRPGKVPRLDQCFDDDRQERFEAGNAERGVIELERFLLRRARLVIGTDDVDRSVLESIDEGVDVLVAAEDEREEVLVPLLAKVRSARTIAAIHDLLGLDSFKAY